MSEDVNLKYLVFFIIIIFCNITEKSTFLLSVGIPTERNERPIAFDNILEVLHKK